MMNNGTKSSNNKCFSKWQDSRTLREQIVEQGVVACIKPRRNRKVDIPFDKEQYKCRHKIECFFQKLKRYRRIATRYDKLALRFLAFIHIACILIWLLWFIQHSLIQWQRLDFFLCYQSHEAQPDNSIKYSQVKAYLLFSFVPFSKFLSIICLIIAQRKKLKHVT